jgi:hypothetical protein
MAIVRAALHPAARLAERVGDAILIVAPGAASAVKTAVDLREAPEREPLFPLLRLGVHGGPVVELDGSYFGTPLNLTARLAAHATAGQILCTESIATAASHLEGVEFRSLGPVSLKNILAPVSIFEVVAANRCPSKPGRRCARTRADHVRVAAHPHRLVEPDRGRRPGGPRAGAAGAGHRRLTAGPGSGGRTDRLTSRNRPFPRGQLGAPGLHGQEQHGRGIAPSRKEAPCTSACWFPSTAPR